MNKSNILVSLLSLLCLHSAHGHGTTHVQTTSFLDALGFAETEFSDTESTLLEIVREHDTQAGLIGALTKKFPDHWPLSAVISCKLSELLEHLYSLPSTETIKADITYVNRALELIKPGTVPFN